MSGNDSGHTVVNYHFPKSGEIPRKEILLFASPCPRKSSSIPTMSWLLGHPPGHFHFWAAFFSVNADFLRPQWQKKVTSTPLSWDFRMSGHPLKIGSLRARAFCGECSGSPVLGLRAFTAMVPVPGFTGNKDPASYTVWPKKKKKVLQILHAIPNIWGVSIENK